jgi:hypothetical protein
VMAGSPAPCPDGPLHRPTLRACVRLSPRAARPRPRRT